MKPQRLLFLGLLGGCLLLALVWAGLLAGIGQGVNADPPRLPAGEAGSQAAVSQEFALDGFESYAEVMNRPLFNEDRRPIVEVDEMPDNGEDEGEKPDVALNVTVTGIIITPAQKLAMVTNNASKEMLRLKEGMQLDGDQSSWTLSSIQPRKLVFDGGGQGSAEVVLETFTQALKGGAPAPRTSTQQARKQESNAAVATNATPDNDDERAARAEEIRRRVAERRAELRAEADRRRAEAEQDDDG